jgi:hypothetical protein
MSNSPATQRFPNTGSDSNDISFILLNLPGFIFHFKITRMILILDRKHTIAFLLDRYAAEEKVPAI